MSPAKIMSQYNRARSLCTRAALPLVVSLQACSADVVNIGENPQQLDLPAPSLCRDSTTLTGEIIVKNQEQLNELEGCEVIDGDLTVAPFAGADLRPLHALTVVEGFILLGDDPDEANGIAVNRIRSLQVSGWLASLEGLESLEHAASAQIIGLTATQLEPLRNLRALTSGLMMRNCPNLRDLKGLENLRSFDDFYVDCDNLESIAALRFPATMHGLYLGGAKLRDLGSVEVAAISNQLVIGGTALEDLEAFSSLRSVAGSLVVEGNLLLEDMNGLNGLEVAGTLIVRNNAGLQRMPELTSLSRLGGLMIYDNPRLVELPELGALYADVASASLTERDLLGFRPELIEIVGNPEVLSFAVPVGWRDGEHVTIENNTKLREVDFGYLESIDLLSIKNNPALTTVNLGALARVDVLEVVENPSLQGSGFDAVQTFEREMSGNAP